MTLRVSVISPNGRAETVAFTGTEVPFNVQVAVFGTLTVAFTESTYTKKFGRAVKTVVAPSVFLNVT